MLEGLEVGECRNALIWWSRSIRWVRYEIPFNRSLRPLSQIKSPSKPASSPSDLVNMWPMFNSQTKSKAECVNAAVTLIPNLIRPVRVISSLTNACPVPNAGFLLIFLRNAGYQRQRWKLYWPIRLMDRYARPITRVLSAHGWCRKHNNKLINDFAVIYP